jgi:hypothetical protein
VERSCEAGIILNELGNIVKHSNAQNKAVAKAAFVAAGLFDFCISIVEAFAEARGEGTDGVSCYVLIAAIGRLKEMWEEPGCIQKIRAIASALSFCLEPAHDFVLSQQLGVSTGASAAKVCALVFGRDEGGSGFDFTQVQIDSMCAANTASFTVVVVGDLICWKPLSVRFR